MGPPPPAPCARCGSTARLDVAHGACAACALEIAMLGDSDSPPLPALHSLPPSPATPPPTPDGWRFAGYEILGEIAQGGMGIVYRARQHHLGREVALKMIRAGLLARPEDILRFRNEAAAAARLRHPNIVAIHEIGEEGGQHFFSMDLIEGPNLADLTRGTPVEATRAARWLATITDAVRFAHEHGILHRDLKPSNVLVGPGDSPVVTDFGLAKFSDGSTENSTLTLSGTVLGSPAYMPPEQARGHHPQITVRSDVYSLGSILYQLLTGLAPFRGPNPIDVLRQVVETDPATPRSLVPQIPADLETICLRCLAKSPADRFGSAAELGNELARFLRGEPILSRPVSRAERLIRWTRREPLLAAIAAVSLVAAFRINIARQRAESESTRATRAEGAAREQLRTALLAQARASRFTGRAGQRHDALAAATEAGRILPGPDAREEAVAALALPDLETSSSLPLPHPTDRLGFDPDHHRYLLEQPTGGLSLRNDQDHRELAHLDTGGHRLRGFPVFSRNGSFVAARLDDHSLRTWSTPNGTIAWTLPNRPYPDQPRTTRFGEDLLFDPQGTWFALGDPAGGVTFHDPDTGRLLHRWSSPLVPRRAAATLDGSRLAVGEFTDDTTAAVVVIDTGTGRELGRLERLSGLRGLAWAPDGSTLAVSRAGRVELLRWPGGELHRRLETPDGPAMDLAFDPDGDWLLTHSSRSVFRWWNLREGRIALELTRPVALSARIAVSSDFRRVALATTVESQQASLQSLSFDTAPAHRSLQPPPAAASHQVASSIGTLDFSPDGSWISVACLDEIHIRDRATGALVTRITRPTRSDWSTARFGADRTTLYVSSRAHGLFRHHLTQGPDGHWHADAGQSIDAEDDFMLCSIHRPTGRLALASARKRKAFKLISPDGTGPTVSWPSVQAYEIAFSPDGSRVVANSVPTSAETSPRFIEIRNALDGSLIRTLDAPLGATARWSADGRWLLTASLPDRVDLWNTPDFTRGPSLPKSVQAPNGTFALSPDGSILAAFNEIETFLVATESGEILTRLIEPPGTQGYVTDMAFSPDGQTLALLRRNAVLTLWDMARLRSELATRSLDW